jgi:sensor histidine kinase YesM
MTKEQIATLTGLFLIAFIASVFLRKRFASISEWIKINLLFLIVGVIGAFAITPFLIPHDLSRNLVALTILPLSTYNIYYLLNGLAGFFNLSKMVRELLGFFAIFIGIIIGAGIINVLGIGVFQISDIKDTLLVAFVCNTARAILSYAGLLKDYLRQRKELQAAKQKEAKVTAQLELLHDKINPHFLYNSLNSIAGLAMQDGKKTREMTIALSKLLRYSLNYNENNLVPVEQELEMVQTYFDMEKIRFDDRLTYTTNVSADAKKYLIPRFLLQPLVENSIKHAFQDTGDRNGIEISISVENGMLLILVHDTGNPFPDSIVPGFGLKNVSDKLSLLFPGKYELEMTSKPEKQTRILIKELKV